MRKEFQKAMDNTIKGIQGVFCFLDDILKVSKGPITSHNEIVDEVSSRLDTVSFVLKLSKSEFSKTNLIWLEFEIDDTGKRPKHSKIEAVIALQIPKSLKHFRSCMGILSHISSLMPIFKRTLSHCDHHYKHTTNRVSFGVKRQTTLFKIYQN